MSVLICHSFGLIEGIFAFTSAHTHTPTKHTVALVYLARLVGGKIGRNEEIS